MKPYRCTICNKLIMGFGYMMKHIDEHIKEDITFNSKNKKNDITYKSKNIKN